MFDTLSFNEAVSAVLSGDTCQSEKTSSAYQHHMLPILQAASVVVSRGAASEDEANNFFNFLLREMRTPENPNGRLEAEVVIASLRGLSNETLKKGDAALLMKNVAKTMSGLLSF